MNSVTAAAQCGGGVYVLIAGHEAIRAAQAAAKIHGVAKLLPADAPQLAENVAAQVLAVPSSYLTSCFRAWQERGAARGG